MTRQRQADRVLARLQRGDTDFRDWPTGFRLASRINDLRNEGHVIETRMVRLEGGTRVAVYTLRHSARNTPPPPVWTCAKCGRPATTMRRVLLAGMAEGDCKECGSHVALRGGAMA